MDKVTTTLPDGSTITTNFDTMSMTVTQPNGPTLRGQLAAFGVPTPETDVAMKAAHQLVAECQVPPMRLDDAYVIIRDAIKEVIAKNNTEMK